MGRSRYKVVGINQPHFLTCTVVNWIPLFIYPELAQALLNSLHFLQQNQRLTLYGYVIMENHCHLIAQAEDLTKQIANFKSFTARQIIDYLEKKGKAEILQQLAFHKRQDKVTQNFQIWQEGSHPQIIEDENVLRQKLDYIHYNPVRRGYIDEPEYWRYSSARDYVGKKGLIKIFKEW